MGHRHNQSLANYMYINQRLELARSKSYSVYEISLDWFKEMGDYLPYGDSNYCIGCKRSTTSIHAEDCFYMRLKTAVKEAEKEWEKWE